MKSIFKIVCIFLFGVIVGAASLSYIGVQAASSYTNTLRVNYQFEQHIMAVKAKNDSRIDDAIRHYQNIIESSEFLITCFENSKDIWTLGYPIIAALNRLFGITAHDNSNISLGIYHAYLSNALELKGDVNQSEDELQKAANLLGCKGDITKIKNIISAVLKSEKELLDNHRIQ